MSVCNPLTLYALSADSSITMAGHQCFDGTTPNPRVAYSNYFYSYNSFLDGSFGDCRWGADNTRGNTFNQNGSSIFSYSLDQYGTLVVGITDNYKGSDNGYENALWDNVFSVGSTTSVLVNNVPTCSFIYTENGVTAQGQCQGASCDGFGTNTCLTSFNIGPSVNWTKSCTTASISNSSSYNEAINCCEVCGYVEVPCPGGEEPCYCGPEDCYYVGNIAGSSLEAGTASLSGPKYISDFIQLAERSAQIKLNIKSQNNAQSDPNDFPPPYCNNSANHDGCWETIGGFVVLNSNASDPTATIGRNQLINFRVGATQNMLKEKYRTIKGRVFVYVKGGDPTTSPCCNCTCSADCIAPCFDGTIILQQEFTLSSSSPLFQPGLEPIPQIRYESLASLDFNSKDHQAYAGQTLYVCSTVDLLTFWNN